MLRLLVLVCLVDAVASMVMTPPASTTQPKPRIYYLLHDEAAAGDETAVSLLLESGFDSNARNDWDSTPLHMAVLNGHDAVADILIKHGAALNAANSDGNTPLHAAVARQQVQCVNLLLSNGADAEAESNSGTRPIQVAAQKGSAVLISTLLEAGAKMDAGVVEDAFGAAIQLCEAKPEDVPLAEAVPSLLQHVFNADMDALLQRGKTTTNVTCLQPAVDGHGENVINDDLLAVELTAGRKCEGGECCEACSRVHLPEFATRAESDTFLSELQHVIVEPYHQFSLQKCAFRDVRTTLLFVRFVERMRRIIAHEWGLPLSTVLPLQTFIALFQGAQDKQGGLHSDESTHAEFHYSCVAYLTSQGEEFEGGTLTFNDANPDDPRGGERVITPLSPTKGSAIIFSSGWENMHEVAPLEGGTRVAIPSFFTTCPVSEADHGPAPANDVERADELWRTLLQPEEVDDFRRFMMRWHCLLAPGHD